MIEYGLRSTRSGNAFLPVSVAGAVLSSVWPRSGQRYSAFDMGDLRVLSPSRQSSDWLRGEVLRKSTHLKCIRSAAARIVSKHALFDTLCVHRLPFVTRIRSSASVSRVGHRRNRIAWLCRGALHLRFACSLRALLALRRARREPPSSSSLRSLLKAPLHASLTPHHNSMCFTLPGTHPGFSPPYPTFFCHWPESIWYLVSPGGAYAPHFSFSFDEALLRVRPNTLIREGLQNRVLAKREDHRPC